MKKTLLASTILTVLAAPAFAEDNTAAVTDIEHLKIIGTQVDARSTADPVR